MPYRSPSQRGQTPQGKGRYPSFDVLDEVDRWDDVTAGVVLARLLLPDELAFFTPAEVAIANPLLDLILDQHAEPRVPILPLIDARLAANETDGWHYDDLPEDAQAWRETLAALDRDAREMHNGRGFADLVTEEQGGLVQAVQDLSSDGKRWHDWSAKHVWSMWTRYACAAYYSHPWAWNEIGFPGPAYPRGYIAKGVGARDTWEARDQVDVDPVTFSARVEHARKRHEQVTGALPSEPSEKRQ
jgi:hypothetical protein